jgi:hypothetical protein
MYKTWFQRQKANSPYRASAALIDGAASIGRGVPIADSAAELKPKSQKSNNYNPPGQDQNEGEDTDAVALKALKDSLLNETDEAKKAKIQEQINALEVSIAAKEQTK